jgi:hypothetical protein
MTILTDNFNSFFNNFRLSNRSVVDNGASLENTTLYNLRHNATLMEEFSVRCVINIENWTAWKLKDALSHNNCGYIHDDFPAPNVDPAYREVMLGHKQVGERKKEMPIIGIFIYITKSDRHC